MIREDVKFKEIFEDITFPFFNEFLDVSYKDGYFFKNLNYIFP